MNLSSHDLFLAQGLFVSSATRQHPLGARAATPDGRTFRYCLVGSSALNAGDLIQSPATVVGNLAKAVNTTSGVAVGTTGISITCGSSVAANFYAEGYLAVASGAGQGLMYLINNHAAVSTGATGLFNLYGEDALQVAITTTSTISLLPNKYASVIQMPATTATGVCIGVAPFAIGATTYGWCQTWGPALVPGSDTTALGAPMNAISTSGGEMSGFTAASLLTGQLIGYLLQADVAQQYCLVDLRISP